MTFSLPEVNPANIVCANLKSDSGGVFGFLDSEINIQVQLNENFKGGTALQNKLELKITS